MFGGIGFHEMLILSVIAILLFGKKLPEVARSLGHSYRELRKSLGDLQSTINFDTPARPEPRRLYRPPVDDVDPAMAPRFEPPAEVDER